MDLFVGKNCIPCKNLKVYLKENNIEVNQIVAEDNMDLAKEKGIRVLPTLILDDNYHDQSNLHYKKLLHQT